ncbi:MAG TPA: hypothetical protein VHW01_18165 [Polyangiaceae bacterium]|nr:hypothetical protein [Polyangiaceae bacterium]
MSKSGASAVAALSLCVACGSGTLDAGSDRPHGPLPVDERNPVILSNDGARDNWSGELALVLSSLGEIDLEGIIVNAGPPYPVLGDNVQAWSNLLQAAKDSGMSHVPALTPSVDDPPLQRPANDDIASTVPNGSAGAQLIVETAHRLSQPLRPLVVAVGGRLTELGDAYLLDPSIADQVVVLASLGQASPGGSAVVGGPNGDIDPWADEIVVRKFRYVQVDTYYAQQNDVPDAFAQALPDNAFKTWITSKLAEILPYPAYDAADQDSLIAAVFPDFALNVAPLSERSSGPPPAGASPTLRPDAAGNCWLVSQGDTATSTARLQAALTNPATYGR